MFSLPRVQAQPLVGELRFCKGEKKKERKERRKGESEEGREEVKERREENFFKGLSCPLWPCSLRVRSVLSMEVYCSGKNFQGRICSRKHSCPTTFGRCISEKHGYPSTVHIGPLCRPLSLVPALCHLLGRMQDPSDRVAPELHPPAETFSAALQPTGSRGSSLPSALLSQGPALSLARGFLPAASTAAPPGLPRVCPTLNLLHF